MDAYPKFIIEDGNLIISKCTYHKQLVKDRDKVQGGGWFIKNGDVFTLYGDSHDFGPAEIEDIQKAIDEGKVYTNRSLKYSLADKFKFVYRDDDRNLTELN